MKKKLKSAYRSLSRKFESIRSFVENVPNNVKMVCQWIPVLWNNWDWDYNFLLDVLKYKLERMSKYASEHGHLQNSDKYAKQMAACVKLIERIQENDYTKEEEKIADEKYGELVCDFTSEKFLDMYRKKARELGIDDEADDYDRTLRRLGDQRLEKDYNSLFNILRRRLRYWWD